MSRVNVDIDERACAEVMRRFQLPTKQDAINFALRSLASEAASVREARGFRGIGWNCDLDELRTDRTK
ncbi:MAG: type II toxin-antitoxin system VapB family antitoxin [Chloroflexi bacterium]|nr:type II toxin-antitoxin system VapB family antitoxin [Chloroflexota bacterium]